MHSDFFLLFHSKVSRVLIIFVFLSSHMLLLLQSDAVHQAGWQFCWQSVKFILSATGNPLISSPSSLLAKPCRNNLRSVFSQAHFLGGGPNLHTSLNLIPLLLTPAIWKPSCCCSNNSMDCTHCRPCVFLLSPNPNCISL